MLNGRAYFAAVADALEAAQSQIFITAWFLSPELLLRRRADGDADDLCLEDALRRAAERGVRIFVLMYAEVPHTIANNHQVHSCVPLSLVSHSGVPR